LGVCWDIKHTWKYIQWDIRWFKITQIVVSGLTKPTVWFGVDPSDPMDPYGSLWFLGSLGVWGWISWISCCFLFTALKPNMFYTKSCWEAPRAQRMRQKILSPERPERDKSFHP
jgi:hypothetical protein